jgi:hypothetical protein
MGYSKLPNEAVDMITKVSVHAWRLYCYLLRCYNRDTRQCNPSATTCAKAINVSLNHIFKSRRELSDAGLVSFDYGAVTFLIGSKDIYGDTPEEPNPIQPDRVEEPNPILPDRQPYPHGYPTLSTRIGNPIHTDNAYKEEPDERTRRKNQTNGTRENCAGAPRAKKISGSDIFSGTENQSVAAKKTKATSGKKGPANSPYHAHPAVIAYRDILNYKAINSTQAELIAQANGAELNTAPEIWLQFLKELAATGNKHTHNVKVMLVAFDHYQHGALLSEALDLAWTKQQGGKNNGKSATRKSESEKLRENAAYIRGY